MKLVSDEMFRWILTAVTGGFAGIWFFHDILFISRLRRADKRDPIVRDKLFGYAMGIVIGAIGVLGALRFNGVL